MLSRRKASCHVADAFLTRLKLIWPISSLKISKCLKNAFWAKNSRAYIRSETKEIHLIYLSEVFQSIGQKSPRIQAFIYLFNCKCNVSSIHRSNSKNISQQRHNLLAYMMYIFSILSLQCIIGRFSNAAVFGFVSGRDFVAVFWSTLLVIKSKTGPEWQLFAV